MMQFRNGTLIINVYRAEWTYVKSASMWNQLFNINPLDFPKRIYEDSKLFWSVMIFMVMYFVGWFGYWAKLQKKKRKKAKKKEM